MTTLKTPFHAPLRLLESTDSTQDDLRAWLEHDPTLPEGTAIIARRQTNGRGRRGRAWVAIDGKSLAISILLRPSTAWNSNVHWIPAIASVALVDYASSIGVGKLQVKWPNDLLRDGKKVAGIIAEKVTASATNAASTTIILGMGVNLNAQTDDFPPDIAHSAGSLFDGDHPFDPLTVAQGWMTCFNVRYPSSLQTGAGMFLNAYQEVLGDKGKHIILDKGLPTQRQGEVIAVDASGYLQVRVAGVVEQVVAGEIEWLPQ